MLRRYSLIFLLLLCAGPSWAAIAVDGTSAATPTSATNTLSWSHTVTTSNVLFVCVVARDTVTPADTAVTSVTYNSVAMEKAREEFHATGYRTSIWYLANPATGTNTVQVTWAGSINNLADGGALSVTGALTSTPWQAGNGGQASSSAGPITTSVTTTTDNAWVMDCAYTGDGSVGFTPGANQTAVFTHSGVGTNSDSALSSYEGPKTPAGAVTMDWALITTPNDWATTAIAFGPDTSECDDYLLQEDQNVLLAEDGSSRLLLESTSCVVAAVGGVNKRMKLERMLMEDL